jgi:translation initiation factor 2 subunit 2
MTEEDPTFDLTAKKKKKKKKTPFDLDAALEGAPTENNQEEEQPDDEEKESTRKEKKVDFAEDNKEIEDIDLDSFGKKKKKKKKRENLDMEELKESLPDDDKENDASLMEEDVDLNDFGTKKKKSKKKRTKDLDELMDGENEEVDADNTDPWGGSDRDYTYDELLQRVFNIMKDKNPEMVAGEKKKFVMRPPQVVRVGTKKTAFANFTEIAKMLHRQPKHLLAFLFAELGTSGAIDGNNQLIMKGRFQQKHIENVLRRYIKEYVTCHTCRSPDTILNKETRLFFLQCMTCHSSCSVQTIKTGFQAVTGKRSAIRAKQ